MVPRVLLSHIPKLRLRGASAFTLLSVGGSPPSLRIPSPLLPAGPFLSFSLRCHQRWRPCEAFPSPPGSGRPHRTPAVSGHVCHGSSHQPSTRFLALSAECRLFCQCPSRHLRAAFRYFRFIKLRAKLIPAFSKVASPLVTCIFVNGTWMS